MGNKIDRHKTVCKTHRMQTLLSESQETAGAWQITVCVLIQAKIMLIDKLES